MRRFTRCLTAWIASVAMLLAGFAPALAHALTPDVRASMLAGDICSSMSKAGQDGAGSHLQHCPDCYTHGAAAGLPPLHRFSLPVLNLAGRVPSLYYQSPAPLFVWASAQSRAPPFDA